MIGLAKAPRGAPQLIRQLNSIVSERYVLTDEQRTTRFRKGYRFGEGKVCAVVQPGTLQEQWRVFNAVVDAGLIVIVQAANTGLNGGSTPYGDEYDREVVIINTLRIDRIDIIGDGRQAVCLAGSTLYKLEQKLGPLGRDPHSIIGSTMMGASVIGGICNNSGGALVSRGPAFTQLALYARVGEDGHVSLVNHLGIELGSNPEEILDRLDRGDYGEGEVHYDDGKLASDDGYQDILRDVDARGPSRYNNDPRLLFEASGSSGKLCVFAVRVDTFAKSAASKVFYIGSNDHLELARLRRHILSQFDNLPIAAEYLHRSAYNLAKDYGKDLYLFLKYFGSRRMSAAFKAKSWFDTLTTRLKLSNNLSDRLLQLVARALPNHLPRRMNTYRDRFEHHLILRADGNGIDEARNYLSSIFPSPTGAFFECDEREASAAFRHRYAAAGACVRYRDIHSAKVSEIMALDVALPRNTLDWRESLPSGVEAHIEHRSVYGHFLCHVFHYDYLLKRGVDWLAVEHMLVQELEQRSVELPSEHNVGHLYKAKPALIQFYQSLDPTNTLNPGIGQTSKRRYWE